MGYDTDKGEDVPLPPDDDDVKLNPEGMPELGHGPQLVFHAPKPPTPTEMLHGFAYWLVGNFFGLLAASAIVSYSWNALQELHHLTTIDFQQTFAALVLLRVLAFTVRL